MQPIIGEIFSWEILVVLAVVALLFGGARLPHLARSLGAAKNEFQKGLDQGAEGGNDTPKTDKPPSSGS